MAFRTVQRSTARLVARTQAQRVMRAARLLSTEQTSEAEEQVVDAPEVTETIRGATEQHTFQAETRKLLDIVAHSLYTDKEIFIRELISNASDACEKARYMMTSNNSIQDPDVPLSITIRADESKGQLIIQDTGVGMTREELISNLGTIAKSGSKEFMSKLTEEASTAGSIDNIIGQFGVGFYSVFMVADKVDVFSQPAAGGPAHYWTSDGSGSYEVAEAENVARGTKIVIHLNKEGKTYAKPSNVERIAKKHSNFISFPVRVNDATLESVGAVWLKAKGEVTEEQHKKFYKHVSNAYDSPTYRLHFHTDAPLDLHALFYFSERHLEKYGMGRLDPGVSLYSRRVLIQPNSKHILPDWLRFVKGVVDSEDIPLNISRENMQDTQLITKIRNALTRRVISFLDEMALDDPAKYATWFKEFGNFIREGVATDMQNRDRIARLLRYESASSGKGTAMSLDEYVSRMFPSQKNIYYLYAPSRDHAESSPYLEAFKEKDIDVLFIYNQIDEMVMQTLKTFENRTIMSVESDNVEISSDKVDPRAGERQQEEKELASWLQDTLKGSVQSVTVTTRKISAPAIVVDQDSSGTRRMMMMMEQAGGEKMPMPPQKLEINPRHPIMEGLLSIREENPATARRIAEQVYDNALITSGMMADPRDMVDRINSIMIDCVQSLEGMYDDEDEYTEEDSEEVSGKDAEDAEEEESNQKPVTVNASSQ